MGCGCNKKRSTVTKKEASKNNGKIIRKNRVSKIISIPGKSGASRIVKKK